MNFSNGWWSPLISPSLGRYCKATRHVHTSLLLGIVDKIVDKIAAYTQANLPNCGSPVVGCRPLRRGVATRPILTPLLHILHIIVTRPETIQQIQISK